MGRYGMNDTVSHRHSAQHVGWMRKLDFHVKFAPAPKEEHPLAYLRGTEVGSWMTDINRNLEGKQVRRVMRCSGGHPAFRQHCEAASAGGYREVSMA